MRTFRLVNEHGWIGGVCGGLAYALGLPAWVIRLVVFVMIAGYGVGAMAYLLLWIFAPAWPDDPADYVQVTGEPDDDG